MGFRMKITGETRAVVLGEGCISNIEFSSDSSAGIKERSADYGLSIKVWGRMFDKEGQDQTIEVAEWAQIPSKQASCYRNVEVTVRSAGQVVRRYQLPNAFVIEYSEEIEGESGDRTFFLYIKQKRDANTAVRVEGGICHKS